MKYLSVVFFAVVLIWTWNVIHTKQGVSFETHSGIQQRLSGLIVETVQAKKPTALDIKVEKVWTELLMGNRIRAHFTYSFKDTDNQGTANVQITGNGLLERQEDGEPGVEKWALTQVKTTNDVIVFEDALLVSTGESK
ncbi:MAG: hypothetical protein BroJett040_12910 [Oligoflexia bacterium]|nr:MAG: hypothetical protein BroJett040_12910 [Oligoflexia bacterium]